MVREAASLVNKCLIATPSIKDPIFESSLIYLCEHNEHGSMGLVVNHQTSQQLADIFVQLDIPCDDDDINQQPVYIGGPVQLEQGFVLHKTSGHWQKSINIAPGIQLTSSKDILLAIAQHQGPQDYMVILGFSSWASGQLESELQQNSWLTSASSTDLLFHQNPDEKWQMAIDTLGFDINRLSPVTGHA